MNILQSFYLSLTILFFASTQASSVQAMDNAGMKNVLQKTDQIALRNNTLANPSRIEEVWQSLKKIDDSIHGERFWLWRTCLVAKKHNIALCDLRTLDHEKEHLRPLSEESIQKFDRLTITHDGIIDKETQNIIISSYSSSIDGKIVHKHYPVKSWYESTPGYGIGRFFYRLMKIIF